MFTLCARLSLLMKLTVCFTTDDLGNMKVENKEVQTEVVETVEHYVQAEDTTQRV